MNPNLLVAFILAKKRKKQWDLLIDTLIDQTKYNQNPITIWL